MPYGPQKMNDVCNEDNDDSNGDDIDNGDADDD